MEYVDLKAQYAALSTEINAGIQRVIERSAFIMGAEVRELETALAEFTQTNHCITCANGTDALQLALMAYGIGSGDAVFVPAFTFMSTAEAVSLVGAKPIFVDIDADTFNISPDSLSDAILRVERDGKYVPRAIIPVDLFGLCADYSAIIPMAQKHGLVIIEDGAQGFGGTLNGRPACSFGDIATTSFFPAKPLGCYGDGGALFTDDDELYSLLCSLRVHGKGSQKYDNIRVGLNSRLDTIQAAILIPKLKAFKEYELTARQKWAQFYDFLLSGCVKTPVIPTGFTSSWAQYTIQLRDEQQRDSVKQKLSEQGIPAMVYYWRPLHMQVAYASDEQPEGTLPVSESVAKRVLSLPMHPYLDEQTVTTVASALIAAL